MGRRPSSGSNSHPLGASVLSLFRGSHGTSPHGTGGRARLRRTSLTDATPYFRSACCCTTDRFWSTGTGSSLARKRRPAFLPFASVGLARGDDSSHLQMQGKLSHDQLIETYPLRLRLTGQGGVERFGHAHIKLAAVLAPLRSYRRFRQAVD